MAARFVIGLFRWMAGFSAYWYGCSEGRSAYDGRGIWSLSSNPQHCSPSAASRTRKPLLQKLLGKPMAGIDVRRHNMLLNKELHPRSVPGTLQRCNILAMKRLQTERAIPPRWEAGFLDGLLSEGGMAQAGASGGPRAMLRYSSAATKREMCSVLTLCRTAGLRSRR